MGHRHLDPLIQRCATFSHIKQLHAHLLTSALFLSHSSIRRQFLEHCALSPWASLDHALSTFLSIPHPNTNDYNSILRGLAASSSPSSALSFFSRFISCSSPRPDALSLSFTLKASARCASLPFSLQLHSHLLRFGLSADTILMTTLIDAYAKCGNIDCARKVFDEMPRRDIATWNVLLSGFVLCSHPHLALYLFRQLCSGLPSLDHHETPNSTTVIAALAACSQLGTIADGEDVHSFAHAQKFDSQIIVQNALIDMYSKCGSIDKALEVFRSISESDLNLISYNTILHALSMHGNGAEALKMFDKMPKHIEPDSITYLAVLCGCNHSGLVDDGMRVFKSMTVPSDMKHYGTIVNMLCRTGKLSEAYDVINSMPSEPDMVIWHTLLGASQTYGDVTLAELAAEKVAKLGSNMDGDYVLLSNVYASNSRWHDVARVRTTMHYKDVRKIPGFSYIEINGTMHKFIKDDKSHPRWKEICNALHEISVRIRGLGYAPEVQNVLHDIGDEEKQHELYCHSEKLAIAFGLITTDPGEEIRVIKNLRICGDCHTVAKLVSKAYNRVIIVRDRARFHRFEGGECTCQDFW
ncbi:tetratricopeptide repeat (TPR)-like superfamily protein [Carex rostrata]